MTDWERTKLRKLQDRFLLHPTVQQFARESGESEPIDGPGSPTLNDVRRYICPADRHIFDRILGS